MDVKDLRTEAALSERNNDGSKYSQGVVALQCNRNKSYQDIGSTPLAKAEGTPVRPCAVIGPDRVVPPPASNDAFLKKGSVEPWPSPDSAYRRPPDYPHRLATANPTRNISPRQTFQENMQRINVPPSYNVVRHSDSANYNHIQDRNVPISKNVKPNMAPEAKYCDVPYAVNSLANEPKTVREADMYMQSVNPSLTRTVPHVWPPGSVNVSASRTYSASDPYQYPQYPNCVSQRPAVIPMPRPRTVQEDPTYVYPEHYFPDANARFKPFPHVKERYPQPRYEYLGNYPGQFHPPPPVQPPKYDIPKTGQSHPYPMYPHFKYLENRVADPTMESYQRHVGHQPHYNIPFRNQAIHPPFAQVPGTTPQKVHPYATDVSVKPVTSNKLHYENNTKMYIDYENARSKPYPVADNYFVNEMSRYHQVKNQMAMPNYSPLGMRAIPSQQYYLKDNPQMRPIEYMPHFRNFEPHLNGGSVLRHAPQFSPNTLAISPTDSSVSNDTTQTHGTSQEDCGYVSQSSTASVRSVDSGIYRYPHEYYKKPEYKYGPVAGSSPTMPKTGINSKDKQKQIDVRQFLSMWNEGEEENIESNNSKEIVIQTGSSESSNLAKHSSNQDQLYVLGLVNVPSEELSKYEHIEKISKLPENIKGYNNLELYSRFEEAMESCNSSGSKGPIKDYQVLSNDKPTKMFVEPLPRPVSPLDVEAKISQSVIHKEVGCNFEIRPCSPKMMNVEVPASAQNILSERVIEKVNNPLSKTVKSPLTSNSDENVHCHTIKKQENSFALTDNPSCKMTRSPFSSNNMEPIKADYTIQDLEINSGVCLASLPRLDNEIELNFPEVNQQFINANKGDRQSPCNNTSGNITPATGLPDIRDDQSDPEKLKTIVNSSDKALNKLTKYRKIKANVETPILNEKAVRTDSVIIKNPENIKNIEDKLLENSSNPLNLCSHTNMTSQSSQWHDSPSHLNENKDSEMALDFSLNKPCSDLPIIELEKDTTAIKPYETNIFLLPREHDPSNGSSPYPTESMIKENTNVEKHIKTDQNNQECQEIQKSSSPKKFDNSDSVINTDRSIPNYADNILFDSCSQNITNSETQETITYDREKDSTYIAGTPENIIAKESDILDSENETSKTDLISNEVKDILNGQIHKKTVESNFDKYRENIKKIFSPDQCNKTEQLENEFEHDEISANLEKLFGESDEELSNTVPVTYSNTKNVSPGVSLENTSQKSHKDTKSSYVHIRLSKELFSPWIQKLLTHEEGCCSDIEEIKKKYCSVFNNVTSRENKITEVNDVHQAKVKNSTPMESKTNDFIEALDSGDTMKSIKKRKLEDTLNDTDNLIELMIENKTDISMEKNGVKVKEMCTNHLSNKVSSNIPSDSVIDTRKNETKKLKKRLHKSKLPKTNNTKYLPESHLETEIKSTQYEIEPEKSNAIMTKKDIATAAGSSSGSENIKTANVVQTSAESFVYQNISDTVIESSTIQHNKLDAENDANEISLTENYSKILSYCNTPDDEEQISKHASDDCSEYQNVKSLDTDDESSATDLENTSANLSFIEKNGVHDTICLRISEKCVSKTLINNSESELTNKGDMILQKSKETSPTVNLDHNDTLSFAVENSMPAKEIDVQFEENTFENVETLNNNLIQNNRNQSSDNSYNDQSKINHITLNETHNKSVTDICRIDEISDSTEKETVSDHVSNLSTNNQYASESLSDNIRINLKEHSDNDNNSSILSDQDKSYIKTVFCTDGSYNQPVRLAKDGTQQKNSDNAYFSHFSSNKLEEISNDPNADVMESVSENTDTKDITHFAIIKNHENTQNIEEDKARQIEILGKFPKKNLDKSTENENFISNNKLDEIENKCVTEEILIKEPCTTLMTQCESNSSLHVNAANVNDRSASLVNNSHGDKMDDKMIEVKEKTDTKNQMGFDSMDDMSTNLKFDQCDNNSDDKDNRDLNESSSSIQNLAITSLDTNLTDKLSSKQTLTFEIKSDEEHQSNLLSKRQINENDNLHALSTNASKCNIIVQIQNDFLDNHVESERIEKANELIGCNLGMKNDAQFTEEINKDIHRDLTSDLLESHNEENKTEVRYEDLNTLNEPGGIADNWITDEQPRSPNKLILPVGEDDYILYDNSEENLCYPVVENSLSELENETCVMTDACILESPVKQKLTLKRSYSDSALNNIKNRDIPERQLLDNTPMWPPKRQKLCEFNHSEQQIINDNICDFIQNNRRNSVSSYYNAENVSFCILIDNDCILTDDNEEEKICFAEVTEDCITETHTLENTVEEIVCCSQDSELDLSDSVMMDYNDKSIQESWLDDVACVETVVSDEIVEETSNDAILALKDTKSSDHEESGIFNSDVSELTTIYTHLEEESITENASQIENACRSPSEDDEVFYDKEPLHADNNNICLHGNYQSFENIVPIPYDEDCSQSPTSDYAKSSSTLDIGSKSELPEDKENIFDNNITHRDFEIYSNIENRINSDDKFCNDIDEHERSVIQHDEEARFPESSIDNVFNYSKREDDDTSYSTSSSPEVSSTTSEEKSSSILLKITNYNGSRVSEINEVNRNRPRCKFTETKDYSNSQEHFPKRPLLTKAARKYIPPLKESIRDLKVKLPLPQQRLLKLKQLKLAKTEPKVVKQNNPLIPKKPKPNFEDVLKSIDEVQIKMHKEKNKKTKNIIPKVVIKKNVNGSHYTSSCSKHSADPDLTGRKWQPWVFLEKNRFIDSMAVRNKTKAIFSHRKNTYVLAEKFQKYKSASNCSAKFVISQPSAGDSSKGQLKYTIRLKHLY